MQEPESATRGRRGDRPLAGPGRSRGDPADPPARRGALEGTWELPGGKVLPGESTEDAARRELAEETVIGITTAPSDFEYDWPEANAPITAALIRRLGHPAARDAARD